jgi:hypothetical protein
MSIATRSVRFLGLAAAIALVSCGGAPKSDAPAPDAKEATEQAAEPDSSTSGLLPIPDGAKEATGSEIPAGHPPVAAQGGGSLAPPPPGSGSGATGVEWAVPAGWVAVTPSSPMRRAQYRVPGPGGDGECVVFYFGPGQGGDPLSNATRWAGQFKHPDGTPAADALKTTTMQVGEVNVLLVEVTGTYSGGMTMTMEPAEPKPGYMLLGAIAEGPDANWFFKLTGPEKTVASQHAAFEAMLKSLKKGASRL